jgi:hypothetical protein
MLHPVQIGCIFHNCSFTVNTFTPYSCLSICADHENIFAETPENFGQDVFSSTVSVHLLGTKKMEGGGAK